MIAGIVFVVGIWFAAGGILLVLFGHLAWGAALLLCGCGLLKASEIATERERQREDRRRCDTNWN